MDRMHAGMEPSGGIAAGLFGSSPTQGARRLIRFPRLRFRTLRLSALSDSIRRTIHSVVPLGCTIALLSHALHANAIIAGLFYAEAKVKTESEIIAGLDEPTRRLILAMPEKVRTETVELVRQSLPLIEKSTSNLLMHIDKILEGRINQLVCAGQALGIGVAEEFKAGLLGTERPKPVKDLVDVWDSRTTEFKTVSARPIAIDYEDLLHQAGITACRLADEGPARRISELRTEARQRWRVWVEIEKTCSTPADCLGTRYATVQGLVAKADPRDVEQAGSKPALALVKLVRPESGPWAWFRSAIGSPRWAGIDATWVAHETELEKLRTIQRSLEATTAMRLITAKRYLTDSVSAILTAEDSVGKAKALLSTSDATSNNKAKEGAQSAVKAKDDIVRQLAQALVGDAGLQSDVDAAKGRLATIEATASQTVKDAESKNQAIADAAAAATREQAQRDAERAQRQAERWERRMPR